MDACDGAMKVKGKKGAFYEKRAAASESNRTDNLFAILAEAEQRHHDALVELTGKVASLKSQFKVVHGGACLFKTSAGNA